MKLLNEIEADKVASSRPYWSSGQPVEYGEPLFVIA